VQSFSSLALKLRVEIEDDDQTYCKNAKFQTDPNGKKIITDFSKKRFPAPLIIHNSRHS